jgi:hypothetical protein
MTPQKRTSPPLLTSATATAIESLCTSNPTYQANQSWLPPGERAATMPRRHGHTIWLFAGSLRAGQRAAAVMSLIQSAKLNRHEPHAYLSDILERLPTQLASRVARAVATSLATNSGTLTKGPASRRDHRAYGTGPKEDV